MYLAAPQRHVLLDYVQPDREWPPLKHRSYKAGNCNCVILIN